MVVGLVLCLFQVPSQGLMIVQMCQSWVGGFAVFLFFVCCTWGAILQPNFWSVVLTMGCLFSPNNLLSFLLFVDVYPVVHELFVKSGVWGLPEVKSGNIFFPLVYNGVFVLRVLFIQLSVSFDSGVLWNLYLGDLHRMVVFDFSFWCFFSKQKCSYSVQCNLVHPFLFFRLEFVKGYALNVAWLQRWCWFSGFCLVAYSSCSCLTVSIFRVLEFHRAWRNFALALPAMSDISMFSFIASVWMSLEILRCTSSKELIWSFDRQSAAVLIEPGTWTFSKLKLRTCSQAFHSAAGVAFVRNIPVTDLLSVNTSVGFFDSYRMWLYLRNAWQFAMSFLQYPDIFSCAWVKAGEPKKEFLFWIVFSHQSVPFIVNAGKGHFEDFFVREWLL